MSDESPEKANQTLDAANQQNLNEIEQLGLKETVGNMSINSIGSHFTSEANREKISLDSLNELVNRINSRKDELDKQALEIGYPQNESIIKLIRAYLEQLIIIDTFLKGVELGRKLESKK